MNTVTFDEERIPTFSERPQGMAAWLLRTGIAKSPSHASRLLILVSLLFILLSVFIMMRVNSSESFDPGRHFVPTYGN